MRCPAGHSNSHRVAALACAGIASAPLWDGEQGRVCGMLSASDFIRMLQVGAVGAGGGVAAGYYTAPFSTHTHIRVERLRRSFLACLPATLG